MSNSRSGTTDTGAGANDPVARRLQDPELRRMAEAGGKELVGILAELDVPSPKISLAPPMRGEVRHWPEARVAEETPEDRENLAATVREARHFFERLATREPVWLSASKTFALETTADRLAEIAEAPFVRTVTENRRRR